MARTRKRMRGTAGVVRLKGKSLCLPPAGPKYHGKEPSPAGERGESERRKKGMRENITQNEKNSHGKKGDVVR